MIPKNESLILLVDDRLENIFALENILEEDHRRFISANSGYAALELAKAQLPTIILLDYQLPDITGLEVARQLRSNETTKDIPILFVTAISRSEYKMLQVFEEGTVDILFKPLEVLEVRNKVAIFERLQFYSMLTGVK